MKLKLEYGFYYRQLDVDEQLVYKIIGNAITGMEETVCITGNTLNESQLNRTLVAISYDNPEFFYWCMDDFKFQNEIVTLKYRNAKESIIEQIRAVRSERERIVKECFHGQGSEQLMQDIYCYLWNYCSFAYDELQTPIACSWIYNIAGVLLYQSAVCLGMAQTVQYFAKYLRMDAVLITGKTVFDGEEESHSWNLLRDSEFFWHHVDLAREVRDKIAISDKYNKNKYYFFEDAEELGYKWKKDIYPSGLK